MWCLIVSSVVIGLYAFWRFLFFFRNPPRKIPVNPAHLLSPSDGKIMYIRSVQNDGVHPILSIKGQKVIRLDELMHVDDPGVLCKRGTLVGIWMSPFDVHYTRAPIEGVIRKISHDFPAPLFGRGRNRSMFRAFCNLLLGRKPFFQGCSYLITNERASYLIKNQDVVVYVTQIADRWIRKIVTFRNHVSLDQGEVFGLIRMGSQVDLFIPEESGFRISVEEGQRVRAGITVLFVKDPTASTSRS